MTDEVFQHFDCLMSLILEAPHHYAVVAQAPFRMRMNRTAESEVLAHTTLLDELLPDARQLDSESLLDLCATARIRQEHDSLVLIQMPKHLSQ